MMDLPKIRDQIDLKNYYVDGTPDGRYALRNLSNLIKKLTGYEGEIVWDSTKPDGQPKRRLSVDRAKEEFGFVAKVGFTEGLRRTIDWYVNVYRWEEKRQEKWRGK